MSYEFNPETAAQDLPNPYRVENQGLMVAGGCVLLCALVLLYLVRESVAAGLDVRAIGTLAVAASLFLLGLSLVGFACVQLRFFFGRGRPAGLTPELQGHAQGSSERADYYKETLRQNAIQFDEPEGALNGLLYSALRELVFAPRMVRRAAERLLRRFLWLALLCLSFLACWAIARSAAASAWAGLIYAALSAPVLLLPLREPLLALRGMPGEERSIPRAVLVAAIIGVAIGPLFIGKLAAALPTLGDFSINGPLALSLGLGLTGCIIFGLALKNQLQPTPQVVGAARVQQTITFNTHPSKLVEELDRILMQRWHRRIPNRRYTRYMPVVNGTTGAFTAELFEEVQPRPHPGLVARGLGDALAKPYFRFLALLTLFATGLVVAGAVVASLAGKSLLHGHPFSMLLVLALGLLAPGVFCFRAAHLLWGRFDFVSELIWVELAGSYEAARVDVGNQFTANLRTSKKVINVEAMTLRVWVSEIDTVTFGKDGARQLIGMRGLQGQADQLASALCAFAESGSVVVAPRSPNDVERLGRISAANATGAPDEALDRLLAAAESRNQHQGDSHE
jgi:hypothetical protein